MERDELIRKLESLAQLDTDAVGVYSRALEHSLDEEVRNRFGQFLDDHMNHADRLSETIERIGGTRPDLHVDMMGKVAEWLTAFRSRRNTEGALHAMETAENYHVSHYREASEWAIDDREVQLMINGFYEDEQRHLEYVQTRLRAPVG